MASDTAPQTPGLAKTALFSSATVLVLFVILELGIRSWSYYLRESYERFDLATQTFTLVPGEHRGGKIRINSEGFAGAELQEPSEDLWRIVSIGESTTFSGGNETRSYSAKLEKILAVGNKPGRRFEVVNGGIQGQDSKLILRRLQTKVLPLDPDVVLIWSGWNDLMKFDPIGQEKANQGAKVSRAIDRLWLVKGMRKLLFYYIRGYLDPPATGPESRTRRFSDFTPTFYTQNLTDMIASIRESRAQPVLLTLLTVIREDMTNEELRDAGVMFPYYPSAYGVGDFLDIIRAYNRAIRRVAAATGVPVVELDRVFAERTDYRELFFDTMHTTDEGDAIIAEIIARFLERENLLGQPEAR